MRKYFYGNERGGLDFLLFSFMDERIKFLPPCQKFGTLSYALAPRSFTAAMAATRLAKAALTTTAPLLLELPPPELLRELDERRAAFVL